MNHYQYDTLRAYAMEPLATYLGTPMAYGVADLAEKLSGAAARLDHEKNRAMELWACRDLTPQEKAAAHLLAVISNHRAISWWRAPDTPDGTDPLPALESWQEERLRKATINAAHAYAAFLPERQAAALVTLVPEKPQAAPPAPVVADSASNAPMMKPKAKRRTWWDVSSAYIVEIMQDGQYATCKELYRALEAKAGPNAPFDKGTGASRGSLFVREITQSLSLKTVQNEWQTLCKLAQK